jgi:hypothetical protein
MKTITFKVNLETIGRTGFLQPNKTTISGNETVSEADNMRNTRSIFLPNLLRGNIEGIGPKGYLHHGDTFTATGYNAIYLKKTYVTGSLDDVLQIVSEN